MTMERALEIYRSVADERPDYDTRDREGRDDLACTDCGGAGIVALDCTSDDGRVCPTCEGSGIARCAWFARCTNEATGMTAHVILGAVPTCDRCHTFATGEDRR